MSREGVHSGMLAVRVGGLGKVLGNAQRATRNGAREESESMRGRCARASGSGCAWRCAREPARATFLRTISREGRRRQVPVRNGRCVRTPLRKARPRRAVQCLSLLRAGSGTSGGPRTHQLRHGTSFASTNIATNVKHDRSRCKLTKRATQLLRGRATARTMYIVRQAPGLMRV